MRSLRGVGWVFHQVLEIAVALPAFFVAEVGGCIDAAPPFVASPTNAIDAGVDALSGPFRAGLRAVGANVVVDAQTLVIPVPSVGVASRVICKGLFQASGAAFE